jgi:NADH:ubiquinone oxidoreductase subunit E
MGGEIIKSLLDALTQKYADKIEVTYSRCLGDCNKCDSFSKAPYVYVDDEVISSADLDKVMETIEKRLNK